MQPALVQLALVGRRIGEFFLLNAHYVHDIDMSDHFLHGRIFERGHAVQFTEFPGKFGAFVHLLHRIHQVKADIAEFAQPSNQRFRRARITNTTGNAHVQVVNSAKVFVQRV